MNKINKIIISLLILVGAGCTTIKKALGIGGGEENQVVDNNSTEQPVDNGVDFSAPSTTNYTEFLIFCAVVIVILAGVNFYLKRNDEK